MTSRPVPPGPSRPWLGGLVLCGGRSRRMGRDKALLPIDGEPLVERVARRVAQVAEPVWLAPGRPGRLGDLGRPEVADVAADSGPLGGLLAGLHAGAACGKRALAVCAVDLPWVDALLLEWLADRLGAHDAVVPVVDGRPQPLHAVWSVTAAGTLQRRLADEQRAVMGALADLAWLAVPPSAWRGFDERGRFARNVNTPDDVRAVLADDARDG